MSNRGHTKRVALLIGLATLVQSWVVVRNQVPAQDAIDFIQFARQLDHQPLTQVLQSKTQHPLYPVLIWASHALFGGAIGLDGMSWVRSAQCVAAFAAVLLVVPMYRTGIRVGSPMLASGATAVFSMLPFAARMGADALGDSTYLLFMFTGIWACTEFLESRRIAWLFVAGLAVGIGFLARPESLLLPVALAATLGLMQCRTVWRMRWSRMLSGLTCVAAGLLCVTAPYTWAIGKLTPKGSLNFLPGGHSLFARFDLNHGRPAARTFSNGQSVPAPAVTTSLPPPAHSRLDFALNHRPDAKRLVGYMGACRELTAELVEGLQYVLGLFVVVGMCFAERRPANLLCTMLAAAFVLVLVQFASKSGYIAGRHVLTLIGLACYVAARGGWVAAGWLTRFGFVLQNRWRRRIGVRGIPGGVGADPGTPPGFVTGSASRRCFQTYRVRLAAGLLAIAAVCCLPRSLGALHQSREAHVAAGRWLAEHAAAGSVVLDSRGWVSLYSELPAYDYNGARLAFENPLLAYVVVESTEMADDRPRGETLRHLLGIAGSIIAEFPSPGVSGESVQVYAWHPERFQSESASQQSIRAN